MKTNFLAPAKQNDEMPLKAAKWLFLTYIFFLPLVRPFNFYFLGSQVVITDFIFPVFFVLMIGAYLRGQFKIRTDKLHIFIILYGLAHILSVFFSSQPSRGYAKLPGEFYLFALAFSAFQLFFEQGFIKKITFAWLLGTGVTVLGTLAGFLLFYAGLKTKQDNYFLSHFGSLPAGNYPRLHSLFSNANMMCNYLNVSLMLGLLAFKLNWLRKLPAKLLQSGIWFAAIFTFSTGIGGLILGTCLWFRAFLLKSGKNLSGRLLLVIGSAAAALIFGAALVSPDTGNTDQDFQIPFVDRKFESSVRVLVWESVIETFKKQPLTGKGTGTDAAFLDYVTLSGDHQILLDAHNNWLNVLGQTGIIGLVSFLLLNFVLIRKCRFGLDVPDEISSIRLALSCAFITAFVYQGLTGSFEDARHLWILIGLLAGASSVRASENDILTASREP
ncbi:MAG: O-antigen ligase family protein [Acidobacteria bacterium]|nr:O-antigen ligase family protein [Acidobacteriota bacterium]